MKNRFTPLHRTLLAATLAAAATCSAQAQSVGIGTTAPNASAALDVVSSARGVLLPRMTLTQRGLIGLPAPGLIIYQTDNTPGFYYNSGTASLPVWDQIATATGAAITATNGLTKTGQAIGLGGTLTGATTIAQAGNAFSLTGGNVGIGTTAPQQRLDVSGNLSTTTAGTQPLLRLTRPDNFNVKYANALELALGSFGTTSQSQSQVDFNLANGFTDNPDKTVMSLQSSGNVGIGTTAPTATLDVNGGTRLRGLTTAGIVTTDGNGNLSSATAASTDATTASNGLNEVGNDVRLGGPLTQATAVSGITTANTFELSGGFAPRVFNTTAASAAGNRLLTFKTNYSNAIPGAGGYLSFTDGADNEYSRIASLDEGGVGGVVGLALSTRNGASTLLAERLRINGAGNVGIGTTTPKQLLDVSGSLATATANTQSLLRLTRPITPGAKYGNALELALGSFDTGVNSHSQVNFNLADGSTNDPDRTVMSLQSSGNVGIGTTTPTAPLDVNGGVKIESNNTLEFGGGIAGKDGNAGKIGYGTFSNGVSLDIVGAGGTGAHLMRIIAEGGTTIYGGINIDRGAANNGTTAPDATNSLLFGQAGSGSAIGSSRLLGSPNNFGLDFYTNLAKRMSITGQGTVGIGTANPQSALDVIGTNYDSSQPAGFKGGGFIRLAGANVTVAPAFATAKIDGTMPAAGGQTIIQLPAGVQGAKALSVTALVKISGNAILNFYPPTGGTNGNSGFEYQVYVSNNTIIVQTGNSNSSSAVYGQPISILFTYEQ